VSDSEVSVRDESRFDAEAALPQFGSGVWDTVEQSWLARNLSGEVASWHAALLNLRYTDAGERPNDCAWYRDPAPYVELHITASRTEVAQLHMWAREPDGLHGYVTYLERPPSDGGRWAPASALRALTPDEMEQFAERQAGRRRVSGAA
jgi:hypothetical protein